MADDAIIRAIGDFIAEVTVKEQHRDEMTITSHPVETGAAITDHAFKNPAQLTIMADAPGEAQRAYNPLEKAVAGIAFTRDLVSEPGNVIYPETLAQEAKKLASLGVTVEILDEKKMKTLGMNMLLGVAQGSTRPARLVVMQWKGNPRARNKRQHREIVNNIEAIGQGLEL